MQNNYNDINTILNLVFSPGDVFEVRCLYATSPGARYQHIESGYFSYENISKVAKELARIDAGGVYFTLRIRLIRASGQIGKPSPGGKTGYNHFR